MKKTALIIALTAAMCAFASCGKEENMSSIPETMSASVTTASVSHTAETTTTAAAVTTTAAATTTTAAPAKTETAAANTVTANTANTDNAEDQSWMSGYWYANGDPKAAFFHITKDGRFKEYNSYYGSILFNEGCIKRELDTTTNSYFYCMYLDSGELYKRFADNGDKSAFCFESGAPSEYVKIYTEGGVGEDGRGATETYTGSWICGRAIIEISYVSEGVFNAKVTWSSSAATHTLWNYPLILEKGNLVCRGNGTMTNYEFKEGGIMVSEEVIYTDGSAEFSLEGNHIFWNDLNEHGADLMLFERNSEAY